MLIILAYDISIFKEGTKDGIILEAAFAGGDAGSTQGIARSAAERICYILLPEGLKEDGREWMEEASGRYGCTIVAMYGLAWNDDLTPWIAEGVFRKAKPFGGQAASFLHSLCDEYFPQIESQLGLERPERYLIGISLSGLFAVWSLFNCGIFTGIASISGSLWYDGFTSWTQGQTPFKAVNKIFISLGDREKRSKDRRMSTVEEATLQVVETLRRKGAPVDFILEDNTTHFSPVIPRLEKALGALLASPSTKEETIDKSDISKL